MQTGDTAGDVQAVEKLGEAGDVIVAELCEYVFGMRGAIGEVVTPGFAPRSKGMTSDMVISRLLEEITSDEKLHQCQAG